MVVHDINGIKVAGLPPEKLGDVDQLDPNRNVHGVASFSVEFLLLQKVGNQQNGPSHHSESVKRKRKKISPLCLCDVFESGKTCN